MGTETYPKKASKGFGIEGSGDFLPDNKADGYQQIGSSDKYSGKSNRGGKGDYKCKSKSATFAKAGGNAQVSATYSRKLHQNGFGTGGGKGLPSIPAEKPSQA